MGERERERERVREEGKNIYENEREKKERETYLVVITMFLNKILENKLFLDRHRLGNIRRHGGKCFNAFQL